MVPVLAGCGSTTPVVPFTLTCTTHRLVPGLLRANLTVTNQTDAAARVIIFGSTLERVRHIYPPLNLTHVVVHVAKTSQTYIGFVVPRIRSGKAAHLILRLQLPLPARTILVTNKLNVRISDWSSLDNPDCHIPTVI